MDVTFTRPDFLWFLSAVPFLIIGHFIALKYTKKKAIKFANFEAIARVTHNIVLSKNLGLLFVRTVVLICVILSASGTVVWYMGESSDFDFVLAIDASSSMLAADLQPTRLDAAKEAAISFVDQVNGKANLGIVSFSGTPFIEQQLTGDIVVLKSALNNLDIKKVGGTNIGDTLVTSADLMLNSERDKTIILLTDGQSNVGSPLEEAINYAVKNHVVIHTIGVGTEEGGMFANLNLTSKLDEDTLKIIAFSTSGNYFKAEDQSALLDAYKEIASIGVRKLSLNLSLIMMLIALVLLLVEWLLLNTKYTTLP